MGRRTGSRSAVWTRWGQLFVLALVLPLALSSTLPVFARALGGPLPHVCQCAVSGGHSTCGCPICNPDRDDLRLNEVSLRGKCGEDDVAFGAALGQAIIPPPGITVAPASVGKAEAPPVHLPRREVFRRPPTPPPRFALS